ncbi:MAG: glycogen/starch synthase [Bacteroidia bacterium]|nr:glycogen/starch synthase [Bacteroidia bacterium]
MEKMKVLFVSQEITPYLPETEMSLISRYLPQGIQERGREIRTFMPKYGSVNERRNQLHEVIRLSGMNLIIDDTDHPLIIKVASIQSARMQVYFIDNEDFFYHRNILIDENGEFYKDNVDRAIFFAKGVIETVKKLRWAPDIVHCHGWMASLVPVFLKKLYYDDPLFCDSQIIISIYDDGIGSSLNKSFINKLVTEGIHEKELALLKQPSYMNSIKLAINNSDAIIIGSKKIQPDLLDYINSLDKSLLPYQDEESYIDIYSNFYDRILEEACVETN